MDILKNKNFAFSLLIADLTIGGTSIVLTANSGALFPSTGSFIGVLWGSAYPSPGLDPTRELVKATLVSNDTFSIVRAQEGTTAKAWSTGDNFALVLSAGKMIELETVVQNNLLSFDVATGTNTYTAVLNPAITGYTLGAAFNIRFANANTGQSTLSFNGLTGKKIYKLSGSSYALLDAGDIFSGMYSTVFYDTALDGGAGGWILVSSKLVIPTEIPVGTSMLFNQASAPVGWTKKTDWADNFSIIVGNTYGTGGSDSGVSWTTAIGDHIPHTHTGPWHAHITGSVGLSVAQLAAHAHALLMWQASGAGGGYYGGPASSASPYYGAVGGLIGNAGGNAAHGHGNTGGEGSGATGSGGPTTHIQDTYTPKYVIVISATKN